MAKFDLSKAEGPVRITPIDSEQAGIIQQLQERLGRYTEAARSAELRQRVAATSVLERGAQSVERILSIYDLLQHCALEQLPTDRLKDILGTVDNVNNTLDALKDYGVNTPPGRPQQFVSNLNSTFTTLYSQVVNDITNANMLSGRSERDAAEILEDLKEKHELVKETASQVDHILESARKAAAEVGVSQQASHFKAVADSYATQSRRWGIALLILVVGGLAYGVLVLPNQMNAIPELAQCVLVVLLLVQAGCSDSTSNTADREATGKRNCSDLEPDNPYSPGSGHYAGFEWAERNDPASCGGNSNSFIEGCEEYQRQQVLYESCLSQR